MSCAICSASLLLDEPISAITACGHVFHTDCLRQMPLISLTTPRCQICQKPFEFPASLIRVHLSTPTACDEQRHLMMDNERMVERIVDLEIKLKRLQKDNEECEKRVKKLNMEHYYLQDEHREVVNERNELKDVLAEQQKPMEEVPLKKEPFTRSFSVRLKKVFRSTKVTPL